MQMFICARKQTDRQKTEKKKRAAFIRPALLHYQRSSCSTEEVIRADNQEGKTDASYSQRDSLHIPAGVQERKETGSTWLVWGEIRSKHQRSALAVKESERSSSGGKVTLQGQG